MQWWMRPGTSRFWAIRKPSPSPPSSASGPRRTSVVEDLGVAAEHAEALLRVLHRRDVAHDRHAGRVHRHDEHRRAPVRRRVGVGDGHHDQEVGDRAVGGEPLVPVEHVAVAVAYGAASTSCVGSEPGVSGSVIENAERSSPSSSGCSQRSFCSACRRARGSRCCPSRAPGSRRRAARRSTSRGSRSSARA